MTQRTEEDKEKIFKLYLEFDGNIHALLQDKRCGFKTYSVLFRFCEVNHFPERLAEIHQQAKQQTNEELASQLVIKRKEVIAICRAILVKYAARLQPDSKDPLRIDSRDLTAAYKIFKTEMGEASEISRHEFSSIISGENIFEHFLKRAKEEEKEIKEN